MPSSTDRSSSTPARSNAIPVPLRPLDQRGIPVDRLPRPLTSFVGREREVASLVARLRDEQVRLLTLTGPGGVGKTRLAIRAAEETAGDFPDNVWFVGLAPVSDPAGVATAIARALDVRESGTRPITAGIREFLRDGRALLVLDNFEHLLDAAPLTADLLTACPSLTILVTSRAVLRVSGEHNVAVPPLSLPHSSGAELPSDYSTSRLIHSSDAVRLFVERARAARSDFALAEEDGPEIVELCRRLDGLPLAIELAASRVKHLPLPVLVERMEQRLPLLTGGPRDQPARLQTMRNAIAWSYDLLSPGEQTLFRRLAVCAGSFPCRPPRPSPQETRPRTSSTASPRLSTPAWCRQPQNPARSRATRCWKPFTNTRGSNWQPAARRRPFATATPCFSWTSPSGPDGRVPPDR